MTGTERLPQTTKQQLQQVGSADIAVGIVSRHGPGSDGLLAIGDVLMQGSSFRRAIVFHSGDTSPENTAELGFVALPIAANVPVGSALDDPLPDYGLIFEAATGLGCRACAVLATDPRACSAIEIRCLLEPVTQRNIDLVVPRYAERKFDALINSGILYPAARALYGRRLHFPMAGDLGFSPRLMEALAPALVRQRANRWIALEVLRRNMAVCEAPFGPRRLSPVESPDLSAMFSEIVGSFFYDMEQNAAHWQRTRGSERLPIIGNLPEASEDARPVQFETFMDIFRLAYRNLMSIWSLVLPPGTLVELQRLTSVAAGQFRLPDRTWARIVYDFALGYRLRGISRDHLLRAMTPLYLAWVASYALEVENAPQSPAGRRIEELCAAYESEKPYLIARWRWPDRFNP